MQQMQCIQTQVCKSLRSLGMSAADERNIENHLVKMLQSNGPEFVIRRLKELTEWRKSSLCSSFWDAPEWHKHSGPKRRPRPSSPLEATLWKYRGRAFFAAVGAIRMAIQFDEPTEGQLKKWLDGVRINKPGKAVRSRAPSWMLQRLEDTLHLKWEGRKPFDTDAITGSCIPGSDKQLTVKFVNGVPDTVSLLSAMCLSLDTAPPFTYQFLEDIGAAQMMAVGHEDIPNLQSELEELFSTLKSNPAIQDEAIGLGWLMSDEMIGAHRQFVDDYLGRCGSVGQIGLLQQPGGKLRSVANPNRFVQWVNVPLGEALSEVVNRLPGVYVTDQRAGLSKIQSWLKEDTAVSSCDLTSATDTLDFSVFLHSYFQAAYETDAYPLLRRSLELFEDTSTSPWTIPGDVADRIGSPDGHISWSQGQPLGLRPSFPLLTLMNWVAADSAYRTYCQMEGIKPRFRGLEGYAAIVGDDYTGKTCISELYAKNIDEMGGIANLDKSMTSSKYAEFCSQLISKRAIYPLKPRFVGRFDGSFENIDKFECIGYRRVVNREVRQLHDFLCAWHLAGYLKVPEGSSDETRTITARFIANLLLDEFTKGESELQVYTLESVYQKALEELGTPNSELRHDVELVLGRAYDFALKQVVQQPEKFVSAAYRTKRGRVVIRDMSFGIERYLRAVSSYGRTSVRLGPRRFYDWRSDTYVPKPSLLRDLRKLARTLKGIKIEESATDLLASMVIEKQTEVTVYFDFTQPPQNCVLCEVSSGDRRVLLDLTSSVLSHLQRQLRDQDSTLSSAIQRHVEKVCRQKQRELDKSNSK